MGDIDQTYFHSCNYQLFVFAGSDGALISLILAYGLLAIFLLIQMCRLCSKVFSYHKFHIHQAYRFYTIAFFCSIIVVIQKITQLKLNEAVLQQSQTPNYDPNFNIIYGLKIMTQIMGVIAVSVTNIMYIVIGFTWLNIILGCDFNQKSQNITDTFRSIDQQPISEINENRNYNQYKKQLLKQKIKWFKNIAFYAIYPTLLIFATFAALDRTRPICQLALVDLLISTEVSYFLLAFSFIYYLKKKLKDRQTPLYTKLLIIYLLLSTTIRVIWFNTIVAQGTQDHGNQIFQVFYNILISVFPILALAWLSEKQLSKQKYSLVKNQRILLMQSTII